LSVINKVIVTCRLETGDDIDVSVKAVDKPLGTKEREELNRRIIQSILPYTDDTLYYKIRLTKDKKKDNWNKVKSLAEINSILDSIFLEE
jgi:hypothetical protein